MLLMTEEDERPPYAARRPLGPSGALDVTPHESVQRKAQPIANFVPRHRQDDPAGYPHAAGQREKLAAVAHHDDSQWGKDMERNRAGHDPNGHSGAEDTGARHEQEAR